MAYFILSIIIKMFADDTTFIIAEPTIYECIAKFKKIVLILIEWCHLNRLDINWSKTYALINHNRIGVINITKIQVNNDINITIVDKFKLLGVTIDNKLNFCSHIADIKLKINRKIHCIKILFFLSTNVKLQFFKTFILPYFDYCLSLAIYFSKAALQKLCNLYYTCLFKFFKINLNNVEANWANDFLKRYNLFSFQHRLFYRLSIFGFKCRKLVNLLEARQRKNVLTFFVIKTISNQYKSTVHACSTHMNRSSKLKVSKNIL